MTIDTADPLIVSNQYYISIKMIISPILNTNTKNNIHGHSIRLITMNGWMVSRIDPAQGNQKYDRGIQPSTCYLQESSTGSVCTTTDSLA